MPHPHGYLVWEGPDTSNSEDCGVQGDLQNAARGLREPTQAGGQAQHCDPTQLCQQVGFLPEPRFLLSKIRSLGYRAAE